MFKLTLDLDKDLEVNADNQVTIKCSEEPGNTLEIRDDGLYAEATQGIDGTGGTGYTRKGDYEGVRIGYESPYGMTESSRRVVLTNVIHRVYTAEGDDINNLKDYRVKIDYVLPGDIVLFNGNIYLVTSVSMSGANGVYGSPGNRINSAICLQEG